MDLPQPSLGTALGPTPVCQRSSSYTQLFPDQEYTYPCDMSPSEPVVAVERPISRSLPPPYEDAPVGMVPKLSKHEDLEARFAQLQRKSWMVRSSIHYIVSDSSFIFPLFCSGFQVGTNQSWYCATLPPPNLQPMLHCESVQLSCPSAYTIYYSPYSLVNVLTWCVDVFSHTFWCTDESWERVRAIYSTVMTLMSQQHIGIASQPNILPYTLTYIKLHSIIYQACEPIVLWLLLLLISLTHWESYRIM